MNELLERQVIALEKQQALLESMVSQQTAFHHALPVLFNISNEQTLKRYFELYEENFIKKFNSISSVPWDEYQK